MLNFFKKFLKCFIFFILYFLCFYLMLCYALFSFLDLCFNYCPCDCCFHFVDESFESLEKEIFLEEEDINKNYDEESDVCDGYVLYDYEKQG